MDECFPDVGYVLDPHVLLGQAIVRFVWIDDNLPLAGKVVVGGEDPGRKARGGDESDKDQEFRGYLTYLDSPFSMMSRNEPHKMVDPM